MMPLNSVLLVEDDAITNFLSEDVLHRAGVKKVEAVTDGRQALAYLLAAACPDLIFLDINMPVMDGFEFLETKQEENICPEVKVAMLTSSIRPKDKLKASSYGVIAYIEKPLTKEKVEDVVSQLPS